MDKAEFLKIMTYLSTAYNKPLTKEVVSIYYGQLQNETNLRQIAKVLVAKERFFPTVARIKEECNIHKYPILSMDENTEWDNIIELIETSKDFTQEAPVILQPTTIEVINMFANLETLKCTWNICLYEDKFKNAFKRCVTGVKDKIQKEMSTITMIENNHNETKRIE